MIKVCYFTSKPASDVRVFVKECTSLAKGGYDVYLVCPNVVNETKNGIHIIGVEYNKKGTFSRLLTLPKLLYKQAVSIDADIYHFNDPASLPFAARLKKKGKKVIFDSFEDHPTLLFEKKRIPKFILNIISKVYTLYEFRKCKQLDGVICCYHWTQDRLRKACSNTHLVLNFPILKDHTEVVFNPDKNAVCYAGLISHIWNVDKIIEALDQAGDVKFNLAGWGDERLIAKLRATHGWHKVNFMGKLTREDVVNKLFRESNIGMALLDYIPLCKGNIGNLANNKLFEYMMMGLPVICTDFILWKEVVEKNNCGLCVNPRDVNDVARAIKYLIANPEAAREMGANGRRMVEREYNWETQEKVLFAAYKKMTDKS